MRFFVSSDETGNIKEVVCARGTDTSKKDGQKPDLVQNILLESDLTTVKTRIVHLKTFQEKWILATRLGGFLTVYEFFGSSQAPMDNCTLMHTYKLDVEASDRPIALVPFEEHDFAMVAYESCKVFVIPLNAGKFNLYPISVDLPPCHVKTPCTLSAFIANPYVRGIFAYGGKENDLQVVKLFESDKCFREADFTDPSGWKVEVLFKAKNVEPDHLGLKVPIWISGILFHKSDDSKANFKLVTLTKYGHIRKYDTAENTRPIGSYKVCENPIISIVFATDAQDEVIVCDTHTFAGKLSLSQIEKKAVKIVSASAGTFYRPGLKLLGKYSEGGNTGSLHGLDISVNSRFLALGGFDRYLRVYEINSRKLMLKVYLGTQISSIQFLDDADGERRENLEGKVTQEAEEFWNEFDRAPVLKKRKRNI